MITSKIICNRIKQLRVKRNYHQGFMANQPGFSSAKSYARLENNESELGINTLLEICVILRIPLLILLDKDYDLDGYLATEFFELSPPPSKENNISKMQYVG